MQLYRGNPLKPLRPNMKGSNNPSFRQSHCSFPGCGNPHLAMGYCSGHYEQLRRNKDLSPLGLPAHRRIGHCFNKGRKRTEKFKEMRKNIAIRQWQNPEFVKKVTEARIKAQRTHPNNLEQRLINLIQEYKLPFKFVGNGEVILGRNCPDFININGKKQVIELFGEYWHNIFDVAQKIERYREYGFSCLVIWESELKQNPDKVVQKIKRFVSPKPCKVVFEWRKG